MPFRLTNTSGGDLKFRNKLYPADARLFADEIPAEQLVVLIQAGWSIIDTETSAAPDTSAIGGFNTGADGFAVAPDNDLDFVTPARALYVGTGGDINLITAAGTTLLFKNAPAGLILQISASRVLVTGTTAADLIGLV